MCVLCVCVCVCSPQAQRLCKAELLLCMHALHAPRWMPLVPFMRAFCAAALRPLAHASTIIIAVHGTFTFICNIFFAFTFQNALWAVPCRQKDPKTSYLGRIRPQQTHWGHTRCPYLPNQENSHTLFQTSSKMNDARGREQVTTPRAWWRTTRRFIQARSLLTVHASPVSPCCTVG